MVRPPKMQPTFQLALPIESKDEAVSRLRSAVGKLDTRDHVDAAGTCFEFHIPPDEQKFWSPHLSVQISQRDGGSELAGRFSPRPEIWTMFMAIYGVLLILMFGAGIVGFVQCMLGAAPWALLLLPLGAIIIGSLHAASLVGQGLSADQMYQLRRRLDELLDLAFNGELNRESDSRD